jgi:hypothetical protein
VYPVWRGLPHGQAYLAWPGRSGDRVKGSITSSPDPEILRPAVATYAPEGAPGGAYRWWNDHHGPREPLLPRSFSRNSRTSRPLPDQGNHVHVRIRVPRGHAQERDFPTRSPRKYLCAAPCPGAEGRPGTAPRDDALAMRLRVGRRREATRILDVRNDVPLAVRGGPWNPGRAPEFFGYGHRKEVAVAMTAQPPLCRPGWNRNELDGLVPEPHTSA